MDFNSRGTQTLLRVLGIGLASFLWALAYTRDALFWMLIFSVQVLLLIKYVNDISGVKPAETLVPEPIKPKEKEEPKPARDRNSDEESLFLKNIVRHAGTGLLAFKNDGFVLIINRAAKKLLKTDNIDNINSLGTRLPQLLESMKRLKTGGRDLVRVDIDGNIQQLSIYAIQLTLHNEEVKLVSFQNIQHELEEKEMEAWQNLVRVLTHEIMNSVTPISSLASTVSEDIEDKISSKSEPTNEDMEDYLMSIGTIRKRSQGLIKFVKDFRNLTQVPNPEPERVNVEELLNQVVRLHKQEWIDRNVELSVEFKREGMHLLMDKSLIEQVLINLIKNAFHAVEDVEQAKIEITAGYYKDKHPYISVKDNGTGIEEEALEKIFIPFFTTRKSGSGIGLSLSRQIMRKHGGTLNVRTWKEGGTEFIMRF